MTDAPTALAASVGRFAGLVRPLDDDALTRPAYPSEWSIAQVVSHLGSGAVIWARTVDDRLAGATTPDGFDRAVWDEWDAKPPRAQADDGLATDAALLDRLQGLGADDRARLRIALGPFELDLDGFVRLRLNEHVLHTWDVAVALDPGATLADDGTAIVVDNLEVIAGFTGRPVGEPGTITVATTDPGRTFAVTIGDGVTLVPAPVPTDPPALTLPAEAFVRLVYGRLDPDHTPAAVTGDPATLDRLRRVFPGP